MSVDVTTALPATTSGGKSQPCVIPTSEPPNPSALTISVSEGRSDTILIGLPIGLPASTGFVTIASKNTIVIVM
jgi:hypothetical protein